MSPQSGSAAARARAVPASPAPLRRAPAPRRVSGPERHPRAVPRGAPRSGLAVRVLDAPFLDRLVRGRVWIAIVAFSLLGIVAMQVAILRLGASIGASVTQIQQLTQSNEAAATTIAQDEPGRNVAAVAAKLGMVYPPPGNLVYRRYVSGLVSVAASSYTPPTAPIPTLASPSLTAPITPVSDGATTTTGATTPTTAVSTTTPSTTTDTTSIGPDGTTVAPSASTTSTTSPGAVSTDVSTPVGAGGGSSAPGTTG